MPRQAIPLTAFTVCDTEPGADIDEYACPADRRGSDSTCALSVLDGSPCNRCEVIR